MKKSTKCYCGHTTYCDCGPEEHKQETLEEVSEKYYPAYPDGVVTSEMYALREGFVKGFKVCAKWQKEQDNNKFSGEEFELIEYIQWIIRKIDKGDTPEETVRLLLFEREKIEQFKKK
jgi:hypothetical protein